NAAASVPQSVMVPAGATTATFTINTSVVNASTMVTITATYGATQTANLTVQPGSGGNTVTLKPVADTFVRSGAAYSNTNYGGQPILSVETGAHSSASTSNFATYLKFDLSQVNFVPTNATLKLSVYQGVPAGSTEIVNLYDVANTAWTENGLTYNNAPGL